MIEALDFRMKKPSDDISKITMLLYGVPKIGKSTFCTRFEDHFVVATEPGLDHLEARWQLVSTWGELMQTVGLLKSSSGGRVKTVIIDTADRMCDMLERAILDRYKIQCLGDLGYGKGTAIFRNSLKAALDALASLGTGLIFVSHSEAVELSTPTGAVKKWSPSLPKDARKLIMNAVDVVGFAQGEYVLDHGRQREDRILHLAPSPVWDAGDRTGRFPASMPFKQAVFRHYFDKNSPNSKEMEGKNG